MSWIALTDMHSATFNIRGIGVAEDAPGARPPAGPHEILPIGTLMLEARAHAEPGAPQTLLSFARHRDWDREIKVVLDAAGQLTVAVCQGSASSTARLNLPVPVQDARLRIIYSWHAPQRAGRLTVEMLDERRMYQVDVVNPVPLPVVDVKVLMRNGRACEIAKSVRYVAVSDEIEPVGLGTGITGQTLVETPHGPVPAEKLRLGDMVTTAGNGIQPVRWLGKRTVPAMGGFRPIRLRAPFFGLGQDLVVAPDHRVRLGVAEAEYMLGCDDVMLEARYLVGGPGARREGKTKLVTYYQVLLDMHECLLHDGLWSESLYVGTIARTPDVARATVLAEMPVSAIPQHRSLVRHPLSDIEVRTLAAAIRA